MFESVRDLVNPILVSKPLVVSCTLSLDDEHRASSTKIYANNAATWERQVLTFGVARSNMDELRLTVRDHRPFAAPDVVGVASYDLSDVSDTAEARWVPLAPAMDGFAASSACRWPCARSGIIRRRGGGAEAAAAPSMCRRRRRPRHGLAAALAGVQSAPPGTDSWLAESLRGVPTVRRQRRGARRREASTGFPAGGGGGESAGVVAVVPVGVDGVSASGARLRAVLGARGGGGGTTRRRARRATRRPLLRRADSVAVFLHSRGPRRRRARRRGVVSRRAGVIDLGQGRSRRRRRWAGAPSRGSVARPRRRKMARNRL